MTDPYDRLARYLLANYSPARARNELAWRMRNDAADALITHRIHLADYRAATKLLETTDWTAKASTYIDANAR